MAAHVPIPRPIHPAICPVAWTRRILPTPWCIRTGIIAGERSRSKALGRWRIIRNIKARRKNTTKRAWWWKGVNNTSDGLTIEVFWIALVWRRGLVVFRCDPYRDWPRRHRVQQMVCSLSDLTRLFKTTQSKVAWLSNTLVNHASRRCNRSGPIETHNCFPSILLSSWSKLDCSFAALDVTVVVFSSDDCCRVGKEVPESSFSVLLNFWQRKK